MKHIDRYAGITENIRKSPIISNGLSHNAASGTGTMAPEKLKQENKTNKIVPPVINTGWDSD